MVCCAYATTLGPTEWAKIISNAAGCRAPVYQCDSAPPATSVAGLNARASSVTNALFKGEVERKMTHARPEYFLWHFGVVGQFDCGVGTKSFFAAGSELRERIKRYGGLWHGVAAMPTTAKEFRQRAWEYLELANAASDYFSRTTMIELAQEFNYAAWKLERALQENEDVGRPPNPPTLSRRH
jgi:hypothetical protein